MLSTLAFCLLAAPSVKLPRSVDFALPNGVLVHLVPDARAPLVSVHARLAGGALEDPEGREGTAELLAALLAKGAGARDAKAFQEAVDFVAGTFDAGAETRWIAIHAEFLREDTDLLLELVADVLRRPRLDAAEFEKERGKALDGLTAAREDPESLLPLYWRAFLFRGHPYARVADEASLPRVTLDDVKALAARVLRPSRLRIAIAGDFDADTMRRKVEARLGDWAGAPGDAAPAAAPRPAPVGKGRVLLVDLPEALQTYFRFGDISVDWSSPDYPARQVANTILGGRFTSRLNSELRIRRGLTYGAASGFDDARGGAFAVRTYTQMMSSRLCMETALAVYREFVAKGMTPEELASARAYIQGQYAPGTIETASQAAAMILALEFDGIPRDLVDRYFERLDALTLEEVNGFIGRGFPASGLTWVVIGRAAGLREFVASLGEVSECRLSDPGFGPR